MKTHCVRRKGTDGPKSALFQANSVPRSALLSTSKGVVTNKAAKSLNIGGEVVCEIS